jgi:hypothetical protein
MKPVLLILALALVPTLCEAQPKPSYRARSLRKDEPQAIYSPDPNDAWNRIFHCLFTRTVPVRASNEFRDAGPFTTFYVNSSTDGMSLSVRSLERIESGDGAIDPLYPSFISTEGRSLVLTEPRFPQLHDALAAALKETTRRPPLARALMQGDAWAAYDLLHDYGTDKTRADQARCDQLLELLAKFIKKLALTPGEIDQLPDNYGAAARVGKVPDLFAPESGWLEVEWLPQRRHDYAADFRRATRVFLKPASGTPDKQALVDSLPRSHGAPAWLDSVAQVTQLLLIAIPSTLQADRNLRRRAARWSCNPRRWACTEQTNGSPPRAPCFARSAFHAARSAKVAPSHQSGTRREFPPFVVPRRSRRCGRVTSTTTSSNCRFAISDTRSPQQHARRTTTRLR